VQSALFFLLLAALAYHVATAPDFGLREPGLLAWCCFHLALLSGIIRNSWFGVRQTGRAARPAPQSATVPAEQPEVARVAIAQAAESGSAG